MGGIYTDIHQGGYPERLLPYVHPGIYTPGIHRPCAPPLVHLLVYTASWCTAVHARTAVHCGRIRPWALTRRNPWVGRRKSLSGPQECEGW